MLQYGNGPTGLHHHGERAAVLTGKSIGRKDRFTKLIFDPSRQLFQDLSQLLIGGGWRLCLRLFLLFGYDGEDIQQGRGQRTGLVFTGFFLFLSRFPAFLDRKLNEFRQSRKIPVL